MTSTNSANWAFETKQIHAAWDRDPSTGATALPIYQTSSYAFADSAQAAGRFSLQELGPIYTRLTNPTTDAVAGRIAALENGVGGLLVSSGQSATALAILALAQAGNNIVASPSLYGGSVTLLKNTLGRLGIETRFVSDPLNVDEWRALADDKTVAFYGETIPNPKGDILDIEPIAAAAHEIGVPLIVDNTVATPYLVRPIEWGADIVVHSATKYLGGHGTTIAGAIVDSGNFDYTTQPERFPLFNEPDESYHGIVFGRDFGVGGALGANLAFLLRIQTLINRDLGAVTSPFNAFLIEQGLETLSLRVQRHVDNALAVAQWLEAHPQVESVNYAGLESSPYHALQQKYAPLGASGLLSFTIRGGFTAGKAFADGLELLPTLANLGDAKSLVIHPASTTHSQLTPSELEAAGVNPATVRLSIGLENIADILADLTLGFAAAAAAVNGD
ncbi:O-acetylhomoserine aminocarboxypropyltransferase/cysteine synthase [Schaalia sp. ZJ405]|uniref:O-acetylhomoserine aminocarboxypropyltransferase/cysteine synthase family protein n=1 Tax=Schaalia sp. ZJ405 TaxID=2709403 RepID=UPI0013ECE871|nr:O-acetylhomoserine aminocarboxypropyltransferase/cysteine synthase family protein [Schaalia sp. ZJ405]QPK81542.1 O-acetylhomoserine aminocarboxypropyltransferase/cysteine synthase [Schaalia sp. ZJ405]